MRITTDRPLLIGHRGAPSLAAENTMASFRAALDAGLDGLEIDVHRTRDGVLAVHHDPATSAGLEIAATTWADLVAQHPQILRLEQVFELLEGFDDRYLNIELKSRFPWDDGREAALARDLRSWSAAAIERTWISCFDPLALVQLARRGVTVPLALLVFKPNALAIPDLIPSLDVRGLHVEQSLATPEHIATWHDRGWFVCAWTVNDQAEAERLVRAGIDGIIGDYPSRLTSAAGAAP